MRYWKLTSVMFLVLSLGQSMCLAQDSRWGYLVKERGTVAEVLLAEKAIRTDTVVANLEAIRREKGEGPQLHIAPTEHGSRLADSEYIMKWRSWQYGSTEWVPTDESIPAQVVSPNGADQEATEKALFPDFGVDPAGTLGSQTSEARPSVDSWPRWSQSTCFRMTSGDLLLVANDTLVYAFSAPPATLEVKEEFRKYLLPERVGKNPLIAEQRGLSAAASFQNSVVLGTTDGYLVTYEALTDRWGDLVRPFAGKTLLGLRWSRDALRAVVRTEEGVAVLRALPDKLAAWTREMAGPEIRGTDRVRRFYPELLVVERTGKTGRWGQSYGGSLVVFELRNKKWEERTILELSEKECLVDCEYEENHHRLYALIGAETGKACPVWDMQVREQVLTQSR